MNVCALIAMEIEVFTFFKRIISSLGMLKEYPGMHSLTRPLEKYL